jgi:hypothetical protein
MIICEEPRKLTSRTWQKVTVATRQQAPTRPFSIYANGARFLAPHIMVKIVKPPVLRACRVISTQSRPSAAYLSNDSPNNASTSMTPADLTAEQRASLDRAVRVDQAGEVAANWIYKGQMAVLGEQRETGPIIQVS